MFKVNQGGPRVLRQGTEAECPFLCLLEKGWCQLCQLCDVSVKNSCPPGSNPLPSCVVVASSAGLGDLPSGTPQPEAEFANVSQMRAERAEVWGATPYNKGHLFRTQESGVA